MQSTDLRTLIASAERELRQARKSSADGLYAITCALALMVLKRDVKWGKE